MALIRLMVSEKKFNAFYGRTGGGRIDDGRPRHGNTSSDTVQVSTR